MRMSKPTFEALSVALDPKAIAHFKRVAGEHGLSLERLRWDYLFMSKFDVSRLYNEGLNDFPYRYGAS